MSLCCFRRSDNSSSSNETVVRVRHEGFFVITTIFNPSGYQSRYELYHQFAEHMRRYGVQLITVECIFPSLGQQHFAVTQADNPNHIQLKSNSVYWMKESLINIAAKRLPPHASWICWLDADIEFTQKSWVDQIITALRSAAIVQVFDKAQNLGPGGEVLRTDFSFGYSVIHGKVIDQSRYDEWYPHPGYGWATTMETFKLIGGLPDYDVVGSGDLHFAFSLIGRVSNALEKDLNPEFKAYIMYHSMTLHDKIGNICLSDTKTPVGYIPVTIRHHWHGSRKNRQYVDRWKILIAHNFNFEKDTQRNFDGLLEFVGNDGLQRDILQHFELRKEDEKQAKVEDQSIVIPRPAPPASKPPQQKKKQGQSKFHFFGGGMRNNDYRPVQTPGSNYIAAYGAYNALDASNSSYNYGGIEQEPEQEHCLPPENQDQQRCFSGEVGPGGVSGDYASNYGGAISCSSQY